MDIPAGKLLFDVHRLHMQLRDVQEQMERGPKKLKMLQQATQQKQDELEAQRQKQKALRLLADQKSLSLKSNEAKIADLRSKLNQASSNREFDIIRAQIDADTMANSVLEDEILDSLEKVDAAQIAVRKLDTEVAAAKADEGKLSSETSARLPELQAQEAALSAQLAKAEALLPGEIMVAYRRLVQGHGAQAIAEVDGNICTVCYVSLPPQLVVHVNAGNIVFCKTCGRILYRKPAAP
jgi:uncharacterized protein